MEVLDLEALDGELIGRFAKLMVAEQPRRAEIDEPLNGKDGTKRAPDVLEQCLVSCAYCAGVTGPSGGAISIGALMSKYAFTM